MQTVRLYRGNRVTKLFEGKTFTVGAKTRSCKINIEENHEVIIKKIDDRFFIFDAVNDLPVLAYNVPLNEIIRATKNYKAKNELETKVKIKKNQLIELITNYYPSWEFEVR